MKTAVKAKYGSVGLISMTFTRDISLFLARTREALALIEATDPAAWRLIQREVRYIMNFPIGSGGEYRRRYRACVVNFDQSYRSTENETPSDAEQDWYVAALASTIIHEATHGRLYTMGIPYNERTRERIERLCVNRERRFLERLDNEEYDLMALAPAFKASEWEPYWDPVVHRAHLKKLRARLWPELRAYWKKK